MIVTNMTALNEEIATDKANLGPGFCIGHSFFSAIPNGVPLDNEWYQRVIDTEIYPLLDNYWFDNPKKIAEWRKRLSPGA
jgi:5-methylcytosine-specific restriction protein B